MSHFNVMVINTKGIDDVEHQLSPFDENLTVPKYSNGYVSKADLTKFVEYYDKRLVPLLNIPYTNTNSLQCNSCGSTNIDIVQSVGTCQHCKSKLLVKTNEKTSIETLYDKHGDDWNGNEWEWDSALGKFEIMSTYNPISKWDWWEVGGRWEGRLAGKDQNVTSRIPWDMILNQSNENDSNFWDEMAKCLSLDDNGRIKPPTLLWSECLKENKDISVARQKYHNQDQVIKFNKFMKTKGFHFSSIEDYLFTKIEYIQYRQSQNVSTYAVLKDGEWISKGEMGWFGMSSSNHSEDVNWALGFYDKIIKPLPPEALITIVDCHI